MNARQAVSDLVNNFMTRIYESSKKSWTGEQIESELMRAIYHLSLAYLDDNETRKEMNLEVDRLLAENERNKEVARELSKELERLRDKEEPCR